MSSWYQQSLLTVQVLEVRLRLGLVPERDHAQVMVEFLEPTTGRLIANWSRPHGGLRDWPQMLQDALDKTNEYLENEIDPF
jgi:NADH:ubiquinone oxidoreductase subunit D